MRNKSPAYSITSSTRTNKAAGTTTPAEER
jgi:hypothetical protein